MDIHNKAELELYFADHLDTILFPVLADIYFTEEDHSRARKVCEIGLKHHPNQVEGLFVFANVSLAEGQITEAERSLKKIQKSEVIHLQGAVLLAQVQEALGRAKNTIRKSWEAVLKIDANHRQAKKTLETLIGQHGVKVKTGSPEERARAKEKKSETPPIDEHLEPMSISPKLATFTLVSVLKNQGLFHQALEVLSVLEEKGGDPERLAKEKQYLEDQIKIHIP
ncbi:MAG: hypothetical protein H8E64_00325 [Candidatus Marinimicrobia bacterium]|nr:hypothetical protein [Candidatus Neomarinimicrobiota bacterium]